MLLDHRHRGREVDVAPERLHLRLVGPRSHQDAVRHPVADRREGAHVRARVRVEPAALLEDRDVDLLRPVAELLPVVVVDLVLPPGAPVVDLAADHDLVELDERQMAEDAVVEDDVARRRPRDEGHRARPERRRPERQRELERAPRPVPVPEVVVVDHLWRDATDVRVAQMRELPLDEAAVAPAPGADAAVRPRLVGRPGDGVVRVAAVVRPRGKDALRLVAAAHVHDDRCIAAAREPDAPVDESLARRLVRRPLDERGQAVPAERQVDVGGQRDPVAHRDTAVVEQADVGELRRRGAHAVGVPVPVNGVPGKWHAAR